MLQEGTITMNSAPNFNLDMLRTGSRVGIVVSEDYNLHVFIDGIDKGPVCHSIPNGMFLF